MGQAKRRGTYPERKAVALRRRETELATANEEHAAEKAERERMRADHRRIHGYRSGSRVGIMAAAALAMGGVGILGRDR